MAWRAAPEGTDGKPYRYLWLLSRGPMSHGCTHVNAGHIAELRQLLPAETERLYDVDVFYNQSPLYDVFDIDGDLTPEVLLDNDSAWSADHCADALEVPGVLWCNRPFRAKGPSLVDVAPSILAEFGLAVPSSMSGKSIFG